MELWRCSEASKSLSVLTRPSGISDARNEALSGMMLRVPFALYYDKIYSQPIS
jgi:hypothetical protein